MENKQNGINLEVNVGFIGCLIRISIEGDKDERVGVEEKKIVGQ